MTERMAPGHVYLPNLGTGIQWQRDVVKLWENGRITSEAAHATTTPYKFWHSLVFADCFPEVTHWWFRSAWTQRVRLTQPQGMLSDDTLWGWMQFVDESTSAHMYTVTDGDQPVITVPYPPNEVQPINLPLRLALSRLVTGVITGEVITSQWNFVTSLVRRDLLELVFPDAMNASPWRMEGIDTPLREALCRLQVLNGEYARVQRSSLR